VLAALITTAPWPTLTAIGVIYLASIPFTYRQFHRARQAYEAAGGADAAAHEPDGADRHPLAAAPAEAEPPPVRH
jgi:CDP-diacylglycerol--serine O-phosphatidyltransferase